ncbi:MAG: hypothetical protein IPO37_08775 [Saprospiraceae bacterium]|nr:hypothetical protein [Saprospiraceae bacterium]
MIAYLHLVLLAFTSLSLLGYLLLNNYIRQYKVAVMSLIVFSIGVFANELVLMVQGVASFVYILIPYLNETLFGISLVMLSSQPCFASRLPQKRIVYPAFMIVLIN